MKKYIYLDRTADGEFLAYGKSLEQAFANSALAMIGLMTRKKISDKIKKKIKVRGNDLKQLLYGFLEEILFLLDSEQFLLSKVKKIKIDEREFELEADITGDKAKNYETHGGVKAVTYNDMRIQKKKDKFVIQVVVDM